MTAAELARQAEELAEAERLAAAQLREQALEARSAAALAERIAIDAEFAEINRTDAPVTGTADVPTTTE